MSPSGIWMRSEMMICDDLRDDLVTTFGVDFEAGDDRDDRDDPFARDAWGGARASRGGFERVCVCVCARNMLKKVVTVVTGLFLNLFGRCLVVTRSSQWSSQWSSRVGVKARGYLGSSLVFTGLHLSKAWRKSEASVAVQAPVEDPMSEFDRELFAVGQGIGKWLAGRQDSDQRRLAEMRCLEMRRFASEGRGDVWFAELRESTRVALVAAGYLPLVGPDDVLVGGVLREAADEVFKNETKELKVSR